MDSYLKEELYSLIQSDVAIFDFIQNSSLDGIWYWDLEKPENEWMSPRFWEVLGYDSDKMEHKSSEWQDIIFKEDLLIAIDNFNKHLEDQNFKYDQIVRYRHKNGSTVWIRCRGVAIRDNNGKPIRMLGAHNDFTPAMKLKDKISEVEKLNKKLFLAADEALVGYWEWDLKTNSLFLSKGWKNFLGYEDYELESSLETFKELIHPNDLDLTMSLAEEYIKTKKGTFHAKFKLKHKTGKYKWVNSVGRITKDREYIFYGFHIDIDDLTTTKDMLMAQSKAATMGEMIGLIAHQLKQPLSIISMLGSNIKIDVEFNSLNEKSLIETSDEISLQVQYLSKTIDTFKDFLMPKKENKEFYINKSIDDALFIVKKTLANNNIELIKEFKSKSIVKIDSSELMQVIINLINNSKDAFNINKIENRTLWIRTHQDENYTYIEIEDTAGGIKKENINEIFDAYFTTKSEFNGTGLGLYIVKTIIKEHFKGHIQVKNTKNGINFTISIPLYDFS